MCPGLCVPSGVQEGKRDQAGRQQVPCVDFRVPAAGPVVPSGTFGAQAHHPLPDLVLVSIPELVVSVPPWRVSQLLLPRGPVLEPTLLPCGSITGGPAGAFPGVATLPKDHDLGQRWSSRSCQRLEVPGTQ